MFPVAHDGSRRSDPPPRFYREFEDERGMTWIAGARERAGLDFKGRFYFVARRKGDERAEETPDVWLDDVCWNSEATARRTLETMSGVELRRRLRQARARRHGRP